MQWAHLEIAEEVAVFSDEAATLLTFQYPQDK